MASVSTDHDKDLKKDAIGFSDGLTIALASTAPAYSPPAVIGVGFLALGAILLLAWRRHRREPFFLRRREVAPAGLLDSLPSEVALDSHGEKHEEQYAER